MAKQRFRAQRKWARERLRWSRVSSKRDRLVTMSWLERWRHDKNRSGSEDISARLGPFWSVSRFRSISLLTLEEGTGTALITGIDQYGDAVVDRVRLS